MASWKLFTALPLLQAASPRPCAKVTSRHIIVIYSLWYLYSIHNICCSLPFTNQFACGRIRFQILRQSTRTWIHRIGLSRSVDLIPALHVSKWSQSSGATTWRPRSSSVFWWANQDLCRSEPWSRRIVLSMDCPKGFESWIITNHVWTWGPWNRGPETHSFLLIQQFSSCWSLRLNKDGFVISHPPNDLVDGFAWTWGTPRFLIKPFLTVAINSQVSGKNYHIIIVDKSNVFNNNIKWLPIHFCACFNALFFFR